MCYLATEGGEKEKRVRGGAEVAWEEGRRRRRSQRGGRKGSAGREGDGRGGDGEGEATRVEG